MKALLLLASLASLNAFAEGGSCYARRSQSPAYDAYCQSFDETPCRMNSQFCTFVPDVSESGSCQPRDRSNPAYAAYCESFDVNACNANANLCAWWQ